MKIKELKKNVNMCWSPREHAPVMLATGTAAQQIDATFNSTSSLDIYSLNLQDPGYDLELKSTVQTQHKFQKLVWSGAEVIVGGCDGGLLQFYSSEKLLNNSPDSLLSSNSKHSGQVSALDVNPYQKNLLSSGGAESEIFIWDLHHPSQPMAPGARSQPHDQVQALAWNHQVQHILGSTFTSRCVVWDLRKNEPIMKLSDSDSRTQWGALCWHPAVATQLVVASKDDHTPVIQLWDLRLASSPLVTLSGHSRGVLSLSWCAQDSGLLLSGGRDGRALVWNPNNTNPGGELLWEVCSSPEWVCEVSWCPRVPAVLAAGTQLHTLLGTSRQHLSPQSQSNILDSFGDASLSALPLVSASRPQPDASSLPLFPHPPAWLKRPVQAKFAFGGKLVTFEKCAHEPGTTKMVYISQVVSDPSLVERAAELDDILTATRTADANAGDILADICLRRGDACSEQSSRYLWFFLRATFLPDFRHEALNLLGFKPEEVPSKFKTTSSNLPPTENNVDSITSGIAGLSRGESTETDAELSTDTSTDLSDAHTLLERKLSNVEDRSLATNVIIPNGEDSTSVICRAIVCGNLEEAAELCLEAGRVADALVVASLGGPDLLSKVQKYHISRCKSEPVSLLAGCVLLSRWSELIESCNPRAWRHVLAALLTHSQLDDIAKYSELLGDKLMKEKDPQLFEAAIICYVCAANPSSLLLTWRTQHRDRTALAQLALLAKRAAAGRRPEPQYANDISEGILREYAGSLAAQGLLQDALRVVQDQQHPLAHRLAQACGLQQAYQQPSQQPANRARTSSHSNRRPLPTHPTHDYPNTASPYDQQASWNSQPPRPGSVGPQPGGITTRSKYKVDPSVQSAPLYGQYSFANPLTSQPAASTPFAGYSAEQLGASVPSASVQPAPLAPAQPMAPAATMNPMAPSATLNPMVPNNQVHQGAVNGSYYPPAQEALPACGKPAPPGWNDPPAPVSKPKGIVECEMSAQHAGTRQWGHIICRRHEPKTEAISAPAPITHPLFGAEPQHVPLHADVSQHAHYQQQNAAYPPQYSPYGQQTAPYVPQNTSHAQQSAPYASQNAPYGQQSVPFAQQNVPYAQQNVPYAQQNVPYAQQSSAHDPASQQYQQSPQQYSTHNYQAPVQQAPAPAPAPEPPAPPAPLSPAHQHVQNTLDALHAQVSAAATTPQIKRKLEDVARRLECLYDVLREGKLSESGEGTLQALCESARAGRWGEAGAHAGALAGGHDFAVAAAFLPGLKTLLQLAQHTQHEARS